MWSINLIDWIDVCRAPVVACWFLASSARFILFANSRLPSHRGMLVLPRSVKTLWQHAHLFIFAFQLDYCDFLILEIHIYLRFSLCAMRIVFLWYPKILRRFKSIYKLYYWNYSVLEWFFNFTNHLCFHSLESLSSIIVIQYNKLLYIISNEKKYFIVMVSILSPNSFNCWVLIYFFKHCNKTLIFLIGNIALLDIMHTC